MSVNYLCPYINFQGHAGEALEFYREIFGGTVHKGPTNQSILDAGNLKIVGTDGSPKYPPTVGENLAIYVSGSDEADLGRAFDALAEGGRVKAPLKGVGYLVDKFGINWIVSVEK